MELSLYLCVAYATQVLSHERQTISCYSQICVGVYHVKVMDFDNEHRLDRVHLQVCLVTLTQTEQNDTKTNQYFAIDIRYSLDKQSLIFVA